MRNAITRNRELPKARKVAREITRRVSSGTLVFVALLLPLSLLMAQWDMVDMGTGGAWMRGIVVGSAKPDGTQSVFAANQDGNLYEFFWTDSIWTQTVAATFHYNVRRMCIGNGRNGTFNHLYVACEDTHVYEFVWNSLDFCWDSNRIETPYRWNWDVTVGEGRNDRINRLYVACCDYVYEYTWNGTDWDMEYVGSSDTTYTEWIYSLELATGRNDDTIRIYASCQNDPDRYGVWEFTWNGTEWVREPVANMEGHHEIYALALGDGRNDGITRIYTGGNTGKLFEYTWNGSGWDSILVHDGETKWTVIVGNGRSDDPPHNRVYFACHDGHVYECTWNGTSWDIIDMGVGIGYGMDNNMWGIDIGAGRNDGIQRVFSSNYDRHVYEFTFPGAKVNEIAVSPDDFVMLTFPNPFNSSCIIQVSGIRGQVSGIEVFDLQGKRIADFTDNRLPITDNRCVIWQPDETISSGIYLVRARTEDGDCITKRIVYLR